MEHLAHIEAEITFLTETEGGRKEIPQRLSGNEYRPHIVVGDPAQRQAIIRDNFIQEDYLAVAFRSAPEKIIAGKSFFAELTLIFWPHPLYKTLMPGVNFTVREGAKIVGYGQVKRLIVYDGT